MRTWASIWMFVVGVTLGACGAPQPPPASGGIGQPVKPSTAAPAAPSPVAAALIATQSQLTILSGDVWARFGDKDFEEGGGPPAGGGEPPAGGDHAR